MSTLIETAETAIATSSEVPSNAGLDSPTESKTQGIQANGTSTQRPSSRGKGLESKYNHVFPVHSERKTSCLSHDAEATPNFVGFRNLMALVLGMIHV